MNAETYVNPVFLGLNVVAMIALWALRIKLPSGNRRLSIARQQFTSVRMDSGDPKYSFAGNEAQVVRELRDSSHGESTSYVLTIHAINSHGEYFVFRSDGDKHSIKHLEQSLARAVLKDDYRSP